MMLGALVDATYNEVPTRVPAIFILDLKLVIEYVLALQKGFFLNHISNL